MFFSPITKKNSLEVEASIDLDVDADFDEVSLQVLKDSSTPQKFLAIYQESHRGTLGTETVYHRGRDFNIDQILKILDAIKNSNIPILKKFYQENKNLFFDARSFKILLEVAPLEADFLL
ncbi:MAG: hypothetical protein COV59_01045 [Candidatus Magasanikbacteria bacterium CG11_big_fil_rev_8_21_14_0_20_39_34]|uniref:Uncharacterized protein n=1 Tax=Candidatus Magasanikbacteria bacterium CG11_big_fil_rev_8_21_14_0_20_39_34 TaxID=1974653 RepID=A0A2H0N8H8_9BACT|nr:MAG: hypothetical protein COV59_01045 [Candidatus Magasanikbacteria bacterium CG11_big_fil_rev_8_21_14_0_20_39_34]